tara:strand:- start:796 stop:2097 length:1302 start_codon:yes stop_codon:yes gene_type:complete
MALICKFLNFIFKIITRPVFSGLFYLLFVLILNDIMANKPIHKIGKIEIIGLNKTKNYIIEREILHPINVELDSSLANLDRNRIFNLGLFDNVSWRIIPLENGNATLQYFMIESINKTPPLVFPGYEEEKGWSLNGLWIINNFQGKNRTFKIEGSFGGQQRIEFFLSDPWMFGNHISLSTFLEVNSYDHLFLNRNINIKRFKMNFGKWYGEKLKVRFSPSLIQKFFFNSIDTLSYNYFSPEINLEIDTRDIFWNPKNGIRIIQSIVPMLGENIFNVWNQSLSIYMSSLFNTTIAMNTTIQRKYGYKNDAWLNYFGNSYNVRGWRLPEKKSASNNYRFGHDYVFSSLELRKLIITDNTRSGLSKGLSIVAFIDGGFIESSLKKLNKDKFMGGVGFGMRIPIPVLQSLRIDIGWGYRNDKLNKKPAFHIAIQQKF